LLIFCYSRQRTMTEEAAGKRVKLTIRCAMQSFEDRSVDVPLDWTVLEFKQHLFKTFPTKPDVSRQRLIYSGHCLENTKTLHDVLQAHATMDGSDTTETQNQVIHLVCVSKDPLINSAGSSGTRFRQNATSSTTTNNANSTSPNFNNPSANSLPTNFYGNVSGNQMNQFPQQNIYETYAAVYQNYVNQMTAMMQQQQYYGNGPMMYHQNFAPVAPNIAMPQLMPQLGQMGQMFLAGQPNNIALGAAAFGAIHPAQQLVIGGPVAMNLLQQVNNPANAVIPPRAAAPVPINNGENRQPDVLDLAYKSIRFALLMMVLYLYSSMERFFFVLLMICVIWFVQMRRDRRNRDELQQQLQRELNREPNPPNDNNNNNALTPDRMPLNGGGVDEGVAPAQNPTTTQVEENNQMNAWTVFWSTVCSFFLSLIPENPVPVNVA
jgi:hypothetical protein